MLEAEPALDAEVAVGDVDIGGGGDLHDLVLLHMEGKGAAHAAVAADGVGLLLPAFIPGALLAHVVLALEHQRAGGASLHAFAASHTRAIAHRVVQVEHDFTVRAAHRVADDIVHLQDGKVIQEERIR